MSKSSSVNFSGGVSYELADLEESPSVTMLSWLTTARSLTGISGAPRLIKGTGSCGSTSFIFAMFEILIDSEAPSDICYCWATDCSFAF